MKKNNKYTALVLVLIVMACSIEKQIDPSIFGNANYIKPMVGTGGHGHVYPGATTPFGMVQLSPDNGMSGWDWTSGYHYSDSVIVGFSHTHLSGTGIGDLCDILIMPTTKEIDLTQKIDDVRNEAYAGTYTHDNELAVAGHYSVNLNNGIEVELTATERVGLHRYHFPSDSRYVVIDLGYHVNWDHPTSTKLQILNDSILVGHRFSSGWAKDQRVYFAAHFSEKVENLQLFDSTQQLSEEMAGTGVRLRAQVKFATELEPLILKIGLSSASEEGALAALSEAPGWDFDASAISARKIWAREMDNISVVSDDRTSMQIFYTALYRTLLAPVLYSDAKGSYKAAGGVNVQASGYDRYDIFSLWDTFRAAHPLLTITQPQRVNHFVRSLLAHYDETGLLPVWSLLGNETNTMTGYHAVPVILDAYMKGFRDYDESKAYQAMKTSAMQDLRGSDYYREYGYIPYDLDGQSVTKTLEYAYDDWCIAQMAFVLGESEDYELFMRRSQSYEPLFDVRTGFMRAKLANGRWKEPFDPTFSDHDFEVAEYTEGNAWQHSWFVPHDVGKLIEMHGGKETFVSRLDELFADTSGIAGDNVSIDVSGLIGQYAHGNEPSHHIAYLYNYAGVPWKTQEVVREIMSTQYDTIPEGLCGNEDCGQMSAWFVFSAMGFYPVNPAEGVYVIGSPLFPKVDIDVGDGKTFRMRALYNTPENIYIQAATLDENPLTRSYLRHWEIMDGGELILEMGPHPNYLHWSDPESYPPSASDVAREGE